MRAAAWGILVSLLLATPAAAWPLFDLSGLIDVSRVDARIDDRWQDTTRQQYTVNAQRQVTSGVDLRAGFRYLRFDLDDAEALELYREEIQPTAELAWSHPLFNFSTSASHRVATTLATDGELVTDNFVFDWKSRSETWPIFGLRYDWSEVEDRGMVTSRGTRDEQLQASTHWNRDRESYHYTFRRRWTENLIRNLDSREDTQVFRYIGAHALSESNRYRLTSQYVFNRRDQKNEIRTGDVFLESVPLKEGLYALDSSPELDALQSSPGLTDGNTTSGVLPPIEIGSGKVDRNIGVDLGVERNAVAAIYLYTDRPSDPVLGWSVWTSPDNVDWTSHALSPSVEYFSPLQRYEIVFPAVTARYIKVVNSGLNTVVDVQVTEIEVLEARAATGEVETASSSHLFDLRFTARPNDRWRFDVDSSLRFQPEQGTVGDQRAVNYALRTRYSPSEQWTHLVRLEQSLQTFDRNRDGLRDEVASYTLLYEPLPTLNASTSASGRRSHVGGELDQELVSVLGEVSARPWSTLSLTAEGTVGRVEQALADRRNDTWSVRSTVDATVTTGLHVLFNWNHQEVTTHPDERLRIRRIWGTNVDLNLTSSIFLRAGLTWIDDQRFSRSQDYLASWRIGPRWLVSGQVSLGDAAGGLVVDRYSANASFAWSSRTSFYVRYFEVDQSESGGQRTRSWQQGLRTSF